MLKSAVTNAQPVWRLAVPFAVGFEMIGMVAAKVTMLAVQGNPAQVTGYQYPPIWPPDWVFWAVWIVIYPCLGVATAMLWNQRGTLPVRRPLWSIGTLLFATLLFLPISSVIQGQPLGLALMDAIALFLAYTVARLGRRVMPKVIWWMVPALVWMPVTFLFKVWYVYLNI